MVTGYPRDVHAGWLAPFTHYPGRVDVCLHVTPIDPATAASRLRRQLARLESGRRSDTEHGRLLDPHTDAATEDAYALADRVARGEGRLFQVGLSLTVHAASPTELAERVADVRALAASMLIDAHPTPYRALPRLGHRPAARAGPTRPAPHLRHRRAGRGVPVRLPRTPRPRPRTQHRRHRRTDVAGTARRFGPRSAPRRHRRVGCSTATTSGSRSLVFWDRFACDNYNSVILGRSGAGKSYLVKLELLRSLYRGVEAHVIDPEDEYTRLAHAVGGAVITPGAPGVHLNPFDLPITVRGGRRTAPRDALTRRALFLHTFLTVLLGEPLSRDRPGRARHRHHRHLHRRRDHRRPLHLGAPGAAAGRPARHPHRHRRPTPPTTGDRPRRDGPRPRRPGDSGRRGRRGPSRRRRPGWPRCCTRSPTARSPTCSPARPAPARTRTWSCGRCASCPSRCARSAPCSRWTRSGPGSPTPPTAGRGWWWSTRPGCCCSNPPAPSSCCARPSPGRKHWAGLTVATQDTADVLGTDLGRAVVTNAATQILLRQAPQAIDAVVDTFGLSDGERAFLLSADRGHALLCAGAHRVGFQRRRRRRRTRPDHHRPRRTRRPRRQPDAAAPTADAARRRDTAAAPRACSRPAAPVVDVGPA